MASSTLKQDMIMAGVTTLLVPLGQAVVMELLDLWRKKRESRALARELNDPNVVVYPTPRGPELRAEFCTDEERL